MGYGFWNRVCEFAEKRRRNAWMDERGHDRRCPNCRRWYSETGTWLDDHPESGTRDADVMRCSGCGHLTVWDMRMMMPMVSTDPDLNARAAIKDTEHG